jgi:hypothetical protein
VIEGRIFVPYPEAGLYSCYGVPGAGFCSASYIQQVMCRLR